MKRFTDYYDDESYQAAALHRGGRGEKAELKPDLEFSRFGSKMLGASERGILH